MSDPGTIESLFELANVRPHPSTIISGYGDTVLGWHFSLKIPKKWRSLVHIVEAVGAGIAVVFPAAAPAIGAGILVLNAAEKGDVKALASIDAIKAAAGNAVPGSAQALDVLKAAAVIKDHIANGIGPAQAAATALQNAASNPSQASIAQAYNQAKGVAGQASNIASQAQGLASKVSGEAGALADAERNLLIAGVAKTMAKHFDIHSLLDSDQDTEADLDDFDTEEQVEVMGDSLPMLGDAGYELFGDDVEGESVDIDGIGSFMPNMVYVTQTAAQQAQAQLAARQAAAVQAQAQADAVRQQQAINAALANFQSEQARQKAAADAQAAAIKEAADEASRKQAARDRKKAAREAARQAELDAAYAEGAGTQEADDGGGQDDGGSSDYLPGQLEQDPFANIP